MLTLHHQPDRLETYRALHPFHLDKELDCLCVFDVAIISAVFRSDQFNVIPFAEQYRYIQDRTGLDFEATIAALDHVPLANEGVRHKQIRAEIASVVGAEAAENARSMEAFVAAQVRHLFRSGAEIDLVDDIATPVFGELFQRWLRVDHSHLVDDPNFSQIFDMKMSLNRRRRINRNLDQLTCAFADRRDQIPTSPEIATAMNILGNDALKGTMSLSLWETLVRNRGLRLDEIDYPRNLPSTGVPYIERVAVEDVEIDGMTVRKGQRVRLMLDATSYHVSGEESDLLFGKGRHVCLGKPMTLAIWRSLIATLKTIPLRFTPGDMKIRTGDYAFTCLDYARVRIHD